MREAPAIQLSDVTRRYTQGRVEVTALGGISLDVPRGQFLAVMGASGSGKSTLLHLAAGLDRPTSGEVALFGQPIAALADDDLTRFRRRTIGLIFQFFNLLPTMTALENVCLPLLIDGGRLADVRPRALALLELVGLAQRAGHRPDELSGGQQQRVAIARALVASAPLLLGDEPTGNLDSRAGEEILGLLRALVDDHGRTVVMVTHDPRAAAVADRTITLSDGRITHDAARQALRVA